MAQRLAQQVRKKQRTYEAIADGQALAQRLTADLYALAHDKHLNIGYHPEGVPTDQVWNAKPTAEQEAQQLAAMREGMRRENFGILDLSVLRYNIGYLNLKYLASPAVAGDSYVAALNYLAHTDALILDLRQCGGATSEFAIPLLCSYFFTAPTHLNDLYWREGNRTQQAWTYTQVPGPRYLTQPLYVLIGPNTFSGAEELAYDLQTQKRATLIGQASGGGANPGGTFRLSEHFDIFLPVGRAINPITHTNWEGVGVRPDTTVILPLALPAAQALALRAIATSPGTPPDWRGVLQGQLQEWALHPPKLAKQRFMLQGEPQAKQVSVAGSFNSWSATATLLTRQGNAWVAEVEVEPGPLQYKFVVDGRWFTDPANPRTEGVGDRANSVLNAGSN
ncbi:S41 family peptidase [Hymenobacter ginkgonis]|nr:S41 family peptidase [Hymenobacter ginkgonis]